MQEARWDMSQRRLSVTLGVRHFSGCLDPPTGVGPSRGASPRAATTRGGQAPAVRGSVLVAAAVRVKKKKKKKFALRSRRSLPPRPGGCSALATSRQHSPAPVGIEQLKSAGHWAGGGGPMGAR